MDERCLFGDEQVASTMMAEGLTDKIKLLATKKVTLGFDGFVDEIVAVVRSKDEASTLYFSSINEFGKYLLSKEGKNFALELEQVVTKIGGNMPIMANALSQLGIIQACVGALGFPQIHPVFHQMPSTCKLHSFANPGFTKALEFNGAKIMLAEMRDLNKVDWNTIKGRLGLQTLIELFTESDLICLLNWSEIKNSNAIWQGLLTDVLHGHLHTKKRFAFVDLADCTRKSDNSILEATGLLKSFSTYWNVVLGLNLNEALHLHKVLIGHPMTEAEIERAGEKLAEQLSIHSIVVHYSKEALLWEQTGQHRMKSFFIPNPKIATGAGDNFNAGYCAGLLLELNASQRLRLGHASSNHYMRFGESPSASELLRKLEL